MGLFDFVKKQFVDVIEWTEEEDAILSFRFPMTDREIQNGAELTVRDSQVVLFVNEGEIADVFEPGRHRLTTQTLPILTSLKNWDKMFQSPFKSDVYFFSTRDQIDQRWGTPNPITLRDKEFGVIRLRAHGTYSYKIKNPRIFHKKVSGTRERYSRDELEGQLRSTILTSLATFFGRSEIAFLDMAANQMRFSETLKDALLNAFLDYGLQLQTFYVQSLSLPEELQTHLDKMTSMKIVGDLRKYAQFQAADSIPAAAANSGGLAGAGMGMAAGAAFGQTMGATLGNLSVSNAESETDPTLMIEKLHGLLKKGILTQAEFESKKAELLKKIT